MRLRSALAVRRRAGDYPKFVAVASQRQIVRVLFDQPVTRLVQRDIFLGELVDRFRHCGDQVGKALHLSDGRIDDSIERPVYQRGNEFRKIELVAERAGPPADGFGGGFAARLSVVAVRQWVECLTRLLLRLLNFPPERIASKPASHRRTLLRRWGWWHPERVVACT